MTRSTKTWALVLGAAMLATAGSASAGQEAAADTGPMRPGDGALTCAQLSEEAAQISAGMGGEREGGLFGRLGGMAKAGAMLLVPGATLAVAGVDAVRQPGTDAREARETAAESRWYYLNGLYLGARCNPAQSGPAPASIAPTPSAGTSVAPPPIRLTPAAGGLEQARNESGPNQ